MLRLCGVQAGHPAVLLVGEAAHPHNVHDATLAVPGMGAHLTHMELHGAVPADAGAQKPRPPLWTAPPWWTPGG